MFRKKWIVKLCEYIFVYYMSDQNLIYYTSISASVKTFLKDDKKLKKLYRHGAMIYSIIFIKFLYI